MRTMLMPAEDDPRGGAQREKAMIREQVPGHSVALRAGAGLLIVSAASS
jgi:hypothetical protein